MLMSKLHEMKIAHRGMSTSEKEGCTCDLCKGLNVNKGKRKTEMPFDVEKKLKGML